MPIEFPCPVCHATVQLLRDGYVKPHLGVGGHPCSFTRTANNLSPVRIRLVATPESRAALAEIQAKQKAVKQERAERQQKVRAKVNKTKCPICGRMIGKNPAGALATHKKPSGRYCSGGAKPSESQLQAQKFRNAWRVIVPGGLPGLGKRR